MIQFSEENKVKLFVVKQNRFNLPVTKLRGAIDDGRFGKMVMSTVRVRWCRTQDYYDQDAWRGTLELDGGVLGNQASHHIDMLLWCMGDVESVFAMTDARLVDIESDDTAVVALRFKSGALGVIEATTGTRPVDLEGSISILGEGGAVEIGGFAMNEIKTWNFAKPQPGDEDVFSKFRENPPDVYGFGHRAYLTRVVEAIRDDTLFSQVSRRATRCPVTSSDPLSASPSNAATSLGMSAGSFCPSPSRVMMVAARAWETPVMMAALCPALRAWRTTRSSGTPAACRRSACGVASSLPSST